MDRHGTPACSVVGSADVTDIAVNCVTERESVFVGSAAYDLFSTSAFYASLELSIGPMFGDGRNEAAAIHPTGLWIYRARDDAARNPSRAIEAYKVLGSSLIDVQGSPFTTNSQATKEEIHALSFDPTQQFLYALATETVVSAAGSIAIFRIDAAGALSPAGRVASNASPTGIAFSPDAGLAFVANRSQPNLLDVYTLDRTTGMLSPVSGSPRVIDIQPRKLAAHPSARWLVTTGADRSTLAVYRYDSITGSLSHAAGSPLTIRTGNSQAPEVQSVQGLAFAPSGKFLYITVNDPALHAVLAYEFNASTGALTPLAGNPFFATDVVDSPPAPVLVTPNAIAVSASGTVLVVCDTRADGTNPGVGSVSSYPLDPLTGAPGARGGFTYVPSPLDCQTAR
jgi:6-phosphogluconolactonase